MSAARKFPEANSAHIKSSEIPTRSSADRATIVFSYLELFFPLMSYGYRSFSHNF
ncbi:hypothetical protein LEP1GSC034_1977 [Leptospira interrogans str. 2003000735]|uniref:Uncharacterized protein n=10 Tax=Leptospira TaxID=171 RepID=A0A0E2D650_LEPIR|nr:hypothetical protein LIMLP_03145 [Leptospira interrogans serovar Manilae]EJO77866.1 hypothetical protein LEP1GSC045_1112 [Leptospira interrogans serovar Pomona str. Kennewicki LC82-25]EJP05688.1 hypothetical protein LEP1GSC007_0100 [Leptospira interrogans serovar Bulgarica str. Mallika]EJP16141.1 hypothetical protein LEP1GSC080_3388 [Leptospira interrogans str. FPW2026]EKN89687.1 hypothetical protein LEP1GSC027_4442 [Leptospira interrogans str. 2002000624]EKN97593.1 hypothetical protein LEP